MSELTNMSIPEKIAKWSNYFGAPIKEEPGFPDKDRVTLAMKLIVEEYRETIVAFEDRNFVETIDGLGDLLWVTIRAMYELGVNPEEIIDIIYKANMSKICKTEEEAHDTIDYYCTQKGYTPEELEYDQVGEVAFVVRDLKTKKILKNVYWTEPDYSSILVKMQKADGNTTE